MSRGWVGQGHNHGRMSTGVVRGIVTHIKAEG